MMLMAVITMIGTVGMGFYLRFLLALCKEFKPRWMNRKPQPLRFTQKLPVRKMPIPFRPAPQTITITRNTTYNELRRDRA